MTSYLTEGVRHSDSGEFVVNELADDLGCEPRAGNIDEVIDSLVYGLILVDTLQGDDPTKREAIKHFVTALAILEADGEGEIRGSWDWDDPSADMAVHKVPRS